jgi:hypothetical protein
MKELHYVILNKFIAKELELKRAIEKSVLAG